MFFPVNARAFYSVTISLSLHANSIDYDPNLEWQSYWDIIFQTNGRYLLFLRFA